MLPKRMTPREGILVTVGLLGLIGLQMAVTDSFYLLQKNFWLDELGTYAIVTDGDFGHAIRALRGAVEANPPALNLMLFTYTTLTNSTSEVAFRSFALFSMILALVGVYTVLRQVYNVLVALAATLAIWSHPLILLYAFDARYYGPWFALAIWFCYFLGRARALALRTWGTIALAVCSLLLCTIHYFGVLSLVIIVGCEWLWQRGRPMYSRNSMAAIAVGPIALVAFAVIFLPHQKATMTVPTWVAAPTVTSVSDLTMFLFLQGHLAAVVLLGWFSRLRESDKHLLRLLWNWSGGPLS